jgi:hypothetical protein
MGCLIGASRQDQGIQRASMTIGAKEDRAVKIEGLTRVTMNSEIFSHC